jgi:hypothetical protein
MSIKEVLENGPKSQPGYLMGRDEILKRENPYERMALWGGKKLLNSERIQAVIQDFEKTIISIHRDLVITKPELNKKDFSVGIMAKWNFRTQQDSKLCDTITISTPPPFDALEIGGKAIEVLGSGRLGHKNKLEEAIVRAYNNPMTLDVGRDKI